MVTLDTTITELALEHGLSRRTLNVCAAAGILTVGKLLTMSDVQLLHLRNCGRHTQMQLSNLRDKYIYLKQLSPAQSALPEPEPAPAIEVSDSLQLEFDFGDDTVTPRHKALPQSPVLLMNLQTCYRHLFQQMSIRACNVMCDYVDFRSVLPFIHGERKPNFATIQHCGEKTVEEINKMLNAFNILYNDELNRFEQIGSTPEYLHEYFSSLYPFLNADDSWMLAREYGMRKPLPAFFLIERFIRYSNNNGAKFFREHYGLDTDGKFHSLEEIARKYNLTRERVRQVLMQGLKFPSPLNELIGICLSSFDADMYSCTDKLWDRLAEENHLTNLNVCQLMALVTAIAPEYMILSITATSFIFLVRRELLNNIQVMRTFKKLRQPIDNQHTIDVEIDVMDVLRKENPGSLHPRVEALMPMFVEPLLAIDSVEDLGGGRIVSHPNRYDPQQLIVDALQALGRDSTLEQIQNEIARQYGTSPIKNLQSLHAYILRNDRVAPIGRSGRYILRQWDNYFTGSITDYIAMCLEQFDQPQRVSDILAHVRKAFPNTTISSVTALMYCDVRKRFVLFHGGRYGLRDKQYAAEWEENVAPRHGRQFADHFNDLKAFVAKNGYIPYGSRQDAGARIAQWMYNVRKGILTPTEDELKQFNDFIEQTAHLPQNFSECRFREMMDSIRQVVEQTGHLPKRTTHPLESEWLRKILKGQVELTPNKQQWWLELRTMLEDRGLLQRSLL